MGVLERIAEIEAEVLQSFCDIFEFETELNLVLLALLNAVLSVLILLSFSDGVCDLCVFFLFGKL